MIAVYIETGDNFKLQMHFCLIVEKYSFENFNSGKLFVVFNTYRLLFLMLV